MDHYQKEPVITFEVDPFPFSSLENEITQIDVNSAFNLWNTVEYAKDNFDLNHPIVLSAEGREITKAVRCAEIIKETIHKRFFQNTQLCQARTIEIWKPLPEFQDDLDPLRVTRSVPVIHILLSLKELTLPKKFSSVGFQKFNEKDRRRKSQKLYISEISSNPATSNSSGSTSIPTSPTKPVLKV